MKVCKKIELDSLYSSMKKMESVATILSSVDLFNYGSILCNISKVMKNLTEFFCCSIKDKVTIENLH